MRFSFTCSLPNFVTFCEHRYHCSTAITHSPTNLFPPCFLFFWRESIASSLVSPWISQFLKFELHLTGLLPTRCFMCSSTPTEQALIGNPNPTHPTKTMPAPTQPGWHPKPVLQPSNMNSKSESMVVVLGIFLSIISSSVNHHDHRPLAVSSTNSFPVSPYLTPAIWHTPHVAGGILKNGLNVPFLFTVLLWYWSRLPLTMKTQSEMS